jgi:hypothetical protein
VLERLASLRAAVAGRVKSAGEVAALRAALTATFESFSLRPLWTDDAPAHVHLDLAVGVDTPSSPHCVQRRFRG